MAVGSWRLAEGSWQLAEGSWFLNATGAVGSWQLAVGSGSGQWANRRIAVTAVSPCENWLAKEHF